MFRAFRLSSLKLTMLSLVGGATILLAACDYGGKGWSSRWDYVEINNQFYEEERTAGIGLRRVLSRLAPPKKTVLEPILEQEQRSEIKEEAGQAAVVEQNPIISRRIPLAYGELNFFSTRPNRGRDLHVTQERPVMTQDIEITKVDNAEPLESVQITPEPEIMEETPAENVAESQSEQKIKQADFLFNEFAKIGK